MAVIRKTIRVLCVDDHRLMREGVSKIVDVQPDMKVVAEANNGEVAVSQFLASQPDVVQSGCRQRGRRLCREDDRRGEERREQSGHWMRMMPRRIALATAAVRSCTSSFV